MVMRCAPAGKALGLLSTPHACLSCHQREFLQHWGVEYTLVDSTNPNEYAKALRPNTRVVYTESPANPTCRLTDLDAVATIVSDWAMSTGKEKPWVMCDSTFATPFHQRCLETRGVDVAIHSATKYIGGHSDILAGAVTSNSCARSSRNTCISGA